MREAKLNAQLDKNQPKAKARNNWCCLSDILE